MAGLPDELQAILDQIKTGKVGVDSGSTPSTAWSTGWSTAAAVMAGALLISRRAQPGGRFVPGARPGCRRRRGATSQRLVARRQTQRSWVSRLRRITEVARH